MSGPVQCAATCNPVSAHEVVGALQLSALATGQPHQHKLPGSKSRSVSYPTQPAEQGLSLRCRSRGQAAVLCCRLK